MLIKKILKLGQQGTTHYVLPLVIVALVGVVGVRVIQSSHALSPKGSGSCGISGVPDVVANGVGITPTVTVSNFARKAFTATVKVDEALVNSSGTGRGGSSQTTITVPALSSVQFKGGTLTAQIGYTAQITASSLSGPSFSCTKGAQVALGSCSIAGVPSTVANGLGVTPTIVVNNYAGTPFSDTVTVDQALVNSTGTGRGGSSQTQINVPALGSLEFKGGTLTAQTGYTIQITATSESVPHYSCSASAQVS